MKGTSHPGSPPTGGFRNTANGGQYALKIVNIGGICQSHLYVPNFLLPADGAMPITEHWHIDVFRPGLLPNMWSLVQIERGMFELVQSMTYPFANRWHYNYNWILAFRCLHVRTLTKHVKFGADWTWYVWVSTKHDVSCCQQVAL